MEVLCLSPESLFLYADSLMTSSPAEERGGGERKSCPFLRNGSPLPEQSFPGHWASIDNFDNIQLT